MFGAIVAVLLVAAPAQAVYNMQMSGTMKVQQIGFNVILSETHTTNATTCWAVGDTFTFTDTEITDNTAGNVPIVAVYKIELYEWVAGSPGNLIDGPYQVTHNVPAGQQQQTNLVVSGTYNGWNGIPPGSCQLSFHVYRHWGVNQPNGAAHSAWY